MDFTREPIIESVITPKEGCKLVVRSSKGAGQEEYFVDAVEVVSFANTFFFRSLERPKSFLVPANDYEVIEVREARMVLKNVGTDRSIKIAGGKEGRPKKEPEKAPKKAEAAEEEEGEAGKKVEKKRERRRQQRRRKGRSDDVKEAATSESDTVEGEVKKVELPVAEPRKNGEVKRPAGPPVILPPPSTLISESIERYKDDALFRDVFFPGGSSEAKVEAPSVPLEEAPSEAPSEVVEDVEVKNLDT